MSLTTHLHQVAYFIRDWRYVHLIIFCPMAILISYYL